MATADGNKAAIIREVHANTGKETKELAILVKQQYPAEFRGHDIPRLTKYCANVIYTANRKGKGKKGKPTRQPGIFPIIPVDNEFEQARVAAATPPLPPAKRVTAMPSEFVEQLHELVNVLGPDITGQVISDLIDEYQAS